MGDTATGMGYTGVTPPMVCCCTPLVVMAPTWVSIFCRALKIPALPRRTDFPLPKISNANPARGWNCFVWFGRYPVEGNLGLDRYGPYKAADGAIFIFGKNCASQRRP